MKIKKHAITECQSDGLYRDLPENSMAKYADNHDAFEQFRERINVFGNLEFAILCLDRDDGKYTWHIHCDEYSLDALKTPRAREISIERKIKKIRHGRNLKCIEVVTKFGEHYFLEANE